ncbi:MAG: hypothetical protein Q8906_08390 [Bacillota bacterium]|nr:hypothetical protein [Bacillota bacterium]
MDAHYHRCKKDGFFLIEKKNQHIYQSNGEDGHLAPIHQWIQIHIQFDWTLLAYAMISPLFILFRVGVKIIRCLREQLIGAEGAKTPAGVRGREDPAGAKGDEEAFRHARGKRSD